MEFDAREFGEEVDVAIDVLVEKPDDESAAVKEGDDEAQLKVEPVEGEAAADEKEGGGVGSPKVEGKDGDGSTGVAEDLEGSNVAGEKPAGEVNEVVPAGISDSAIERAVRSGITVSEARTFSSDESLLKIVDAKEQFSNSVEEFDGKEEKPGDLEELIGEIPDLDPKEFTPETVAMLGALKNIITQQQEQIRDIHDQQGEAQAAQFDASAKEIEGWFDSEVEALGEGFVEALGSGGISGLQQGSSQYAKRSEIATRVGVMKAGYEASGIPAPSRSKLFKTASQEVLREEFRQQSDKETAEKLKQRSGQHIQRGSGRKENNQLSPEEEAAQELDRKYPPSS